METLLDLSVLFMELFEVLLPVQTKRVRDQVLGELLDAFEIPEYLLWDFDRSITADEV